MELLATEAPDPAAEPFVEVLLRSGHHLRLHGTIDASAVARLAVALESC